MKKQRRCHVIPMWKFVHDFDHHARWGPKRMIAEKLNASENVLGFWQWGLRLASSQHGWLNVSNFMIAS